MTDDQIVEAIGRLVSEGAYRDELPMRPGARLHDDHIFQDGFAGVLQRLVPRGSPEHQEALLAGDMESLPPLRPASIEAVEEAEGIIGRPLPSILRSLYLSVANGGFGPGYGVLGVRDGHEDDTRRTAVGLFEQRWWVRPNIVLWPLCHWGCAIYSLVNCNSADGAIWAFDPNPGPVEEAVFPQELSLHDWFERWLESKLFQPTLTQDPDSGLWRGATDDEIEGWQPDIEQDPDVAEPREL
jgi:hypothetical protein